MTTITLNGANEVEQNGPGIDWNAVMTAASNFIGAIIGVIVIGVIALKKYLPGALDSVATEHGGPVVAAIEGVRGSIDNLQASVTKLEEAVTKSQVDYGRMEERVANLSREVNDLKVELRHRRESDRRIP